MITPNGFVRTNEIDYIEVKEEIVGGRIVYSILFFLSQTAKKKTFYWIVEP